MEGPEPHFTEDEEVNEKVLKQYGLWDVKARPPPKKWIGGPEILSIGPCPFENQRVGPVRPG
jgi:hypothetical protein